MERNNIQKIQDSLYKREAPQMSDLSDFSVSVVASAVLPETEDEAKIDKVKAYIRDVNLLGNCIANNINDFSLENAQCILEVVEAFNEEYPEISSLWTASQNLNEYITCRRHPEINLYNALTDVMLRYNRLAAVAEASDKDEKRVACEAVLSDIFGFKNGERKRTGWHFTKEELKRAESQLGYQ